MANTAASEAARATEQAAGRDRRPVAGEAFIGDVWYVAALSRDVRVNRPVSQMVCGRTLTLHRETSGSVRGEADGEAVALCEAHDLVWYCHGDPLRAQPIPPIKPPKDKVRYCATVEIPADLDNAAYGLLDPAHTPFVHKSPIWRGSGILKDKTKVFEPNTFGWTMVPHAPVNSDIYKIIGGQISVRIEFRLPGHRAEYIQNRAHTVLGFTTLTPIDGATTRLRQIFFWDSPVLWALRPFVPFVAKPFLQQDVEIMRLRAKNEQYGGRGMLVGDSDRQFIWYTQVKREWLAARRENRPFANPLQSATLKWRT